jgi:serine/threonine-protein kinase
MGSAYLARALDRTSGLPDPLVVKTMRADLARGSTAEARFRHEAEIAVLLDNPHVAAVYSVGSVGYQLFIAMEYVPGWRVGQLLDRVQALGRSLELRVVLRLVRDALAGLEAIHGVRDTDGRPLDAVHRDLSPRNLIISSSGELVLIDLGLGKSNSQDWQTRTGDVLGTPGYMAPEQIRGGKIDRRSDLYTLGILFFEMLTLEPYIARGSAAALLDRSLSPRFRAPSSLRADLPAALDRVLERMLEVDPAARFQSAEELRAALDAFGPDAGPDGVLGTLELMFGPPVAEEPTVAWPPPEPGPPDSTPPVLTSVFARRSAETLPAVATATVATKAGPTRTALNPLGGSSVPAPSITAFSATPRSPRSPRTALPLLAAGALLAAAVLGAIRLSRPAAQPASAPLPVATPAAPRSVPVTPAPTERETPPATPPPEPSSAAARPPIHRVHRAGASAPATLATPATPATSAMAATPSGPAAPPAAPAPAPVPTADDAEPAEAMVRRLTQLGQELKRRLSAADQAPLRAEIDDVLGDVTLAAARGDKRELKMLEARLRRLSPARQQ